MAITKILVELLASVPPQIATLIIAALPIAELRASLPVALTIYKLSLPEALFWSILGNMLPVYFLLVFFEKGAAWISARSPLAATWLDVLYDHTRRKLSGRIEKYGLVALAILVGTPLPVLGGSWTGTIAAFVFGIPKKKAFWAIFVGVCIAATLVALLTTGTIASVRYLAN